VVSNQQALEGEGVVICVAASDGSSLQHCRMGGQRRQQQQQRSAAEQALYDAARNDRVQPVFDGG
jgi:hypothetical protein